MGIYEIVGLLDVVVLICMYLFIGVMCMSPTSFVELGRSVMLKNIVCWPRPIIKHLLSKFRSVVLSKLY